MTHINGYQAQSSFSTQTSAPRKLASHRVERIEIRALVVLTYPVFLCAAVVSRMGFGHSRFAAAVSERPLSVFAEARQMAQATILSAFLG